jgi:Dolichyl-phosphate-mannose-protein mannosyltransferase
VVERTQLNRSVHQQIWLGRLLVFAAVIPILVALFMVLLPAQTASTWAAHLGHGEDVTPDRIARLRIVGCVLTVTHVMVFGLLLTARRSAAVQFLVTLWAEVSRASPRTGVRQLIAWATEPGWFHLIMFIMTLAVACSIRFAYLRVPMDYDESHSFLNYASRPLYQGLVDYGSTNNHLLNTLCMHVAFKSFGPWEWSLRLHVFLAGLGAVGTIYVLARSLVGADAGLIAAAIAATSYVMVNYSVNARG